MGSASPLKELLSDGVAHENLERIRCRVHASRRIRLRRAQWVRTLAGSSLVTLALLGAVVLLRRDSNDSSLHSAAATAGPIAALDGSNLAALVAAEQVRVVPLSDGSALRLEPRAQLSCFENEGRRVRFAMGLGTAAFDIRPGGPRRWSIDVGGVTVEVLGTAFSIDRSEHRVRVSVDRGRVLVRGGRVPQGFVHLTAGEVVEVWLDDASEHDDSSETATRGVAPLEVESSRTLQAPPVSARRAATGWRALADAGDHDAAYNLLGRDGLVQEGARANVSQLFVLADVARLSGHPYEAVPILEAIIRDHPEHPESAVAAFTLGRLASDVLRQPGRAAAAFETAIALGPPTSLREASYARLAEARHRAGDEAGADAAIDAYLQRFPTGRYAEKFRSMR